MNILKFLKKIELLNQLNCWYKGNYQNYKAKREFSFFNKLAADKKISVPEHDKLYRMLNERLASKKIKPNPKKKEQLHVFLVYEQNNWEAVLPKTLSSFGKLTVFEWKSHGFSQNSKDWLSKRLEMNKKMLKVFNEANQKQKIDAVVGYLSSYTISKEVLNEFSSKGAVIYNFCWDDKLFFKEPRKKRIYYGQAAIASAVDLNLTNAPDSCIKYMVCGGLAMFWPEAASPDVHKPYNIPFEYDVSFIGKKYGFRPQLIKYLRDNGIKVAAFGHGWENTSLSDEEMVKLYSKSKINLGFACVAQSNKLMCLKGRDFEVPMSGGLYLTQNNPELALVYKIGKEILTYSNKQDCLENIKWILKNPLEVENIRKDGRARALKDHTWEKRFSDIFRLSGLMN